MEVTQEIFDYLLTRNQLLSKSIEDINSKNSEPSEYEDYVSRILKLIQRENIESVSAHIERKIINTVTAYRDKTTKETKNKINEIIGIINLYKAKADTEKRKMKYEFLVNEMKDRDAPVIYENVGDKFIDLANTDYCTFLAEYDVYDGRTGEQITTDFKPSIYQYLALINLLYNRFPAAFTIENFAAAAAFRLEKMALDGNRISNKA